MATETEILSLSLPTTAPSTTIQTDATASTCLPSSAETFSQRFGSVRSGSISEGKDALSWDPSIIPKADFLNLGPSEEARRRHYSRQNSFSRPKQKRPCIEVEEGDEDCSDSCPGSSIEESCKRALEHFPCPAIDIPTPALEFDFRVAVTLKPEPSRIESRRTGSTVTPNSATMWQQMSSKTGTDSKPFSSIPSRPTPPAPGQTPSFGATTASQQREITSISSGRWSGSFGNGRVLAGGYDLGQARGFRPIRVVEGAFVMQTTDSPPAILEMRTRGSLSGPADVLDTLLSPRQPKEIDARRYGFRMFSTIKTADKRYAEIVNCGLWVASGVWKDEELIIEVP